MDVTIYHNPRCSKSRRTLELLRARGLAVGVVEYLSDPPDAAVLSDLIERLGKAPRDLMRKKEVAYRELGLDDPGLGRDELIAAMVANPILIERPIVVAGTKAALGRPPEAVLEILD